jgi:hypothetical protein
MNNSIDTDLPSASQTSYILAEVALNLRWSWNHAADQLWERLDPELWDLTPTAPNPVTTTCTTLGATRFTIASIELLN